ncbi:25S rRNA (adenine2142-N1)-methyltransferase [Coemansia sp. RSA 1804]|nr:25S rRNA (adenine2142-N1)-methyltransferase [Coemansia sp. RSA 1804]
MDMSGVPTVPRERLGKSSAETRRRINRFHALIKEQTKLVARRNKEDSVESCVQIQEMIDRLLQEMAQMGGLDWYQKASLLGQCKQRGGDTSRWLVPKLNELGFGKDRKGTRLRLLDVGALSSSNYVKERQWIDVVPIDLNPQEPGIHKQDLLDIDPTNLLSGALSADRANTAVESGDSEDEDNGISQLFAQPFDVVCLSLVINFIGDPVRRGDMLKQAGRLLDAGGLLFVVLPLSCITNSRYFDDERLLAIAQHMGFKQLHAHHTTKLAYYLYRLESAGLLAETQSELRFKKQLLHPEAGRNNFSIAV